MALLERRAAVARLLADRGDLLVVTGLGSPTYDVATVGDDPRNFHLWGAMGNAALVGLGLAVAQPTRRVLVLTGDGEMLMGMGGLATVAVQRPPNLSIIVIDNERYGETGRQKSHTAHGVDLEAVARGCGFSLVDTILDEAGLDRLARGLHEVVGPLFAVVKVAPSEPPRALPTRDGVELKNRFRKALLGRA